MANKYLRIPFEVEGRRYEAIGNYKEGYPHCFVDEALRRAEDENGGAIKGEEETWLRERHAKFPRELDPYTLITGKRHSEYPDLISILSRSRDRCGWMEKVSIFRTRHLIVRRCNQ